MKEKIDQVLTRGGKALGMDLHFYGKGSLWLTLTQVASIFTGLILSLLYARFLSKVVFGQYVFVHSLIAFFGSFAYPGLTTAVVRAVAQKREHILTQASRKTLPWATLSALPFLGLTNFYLFKTPPDFTLAKTFCACFFLTIILWSYRFYEAYFTGKGQFKNYFFLSLVFNLLTIFSLGLITILLPSTFYLVLVSLGVNAIFSFLVTQNISRKLKTIKFALKDLNFANNLNDIRLIGNLVVYADKIIIAKFLGFEAIAIFSFAQLIPEHIRGYLKNFSILSLARMSQGQFILNKTRFFKRLGQFLILSFVCVVAYFFSAPILFHYLFPTYQEAVGLSQLYALSLLSAPVLLIFSLFEAKADTVSLRWLTYLQYSLQLLLLFLLTWRFQLLGTIAAVTLGRFFSLIIGVILLRKNKLS